MNIFGVGDRPNDTDIAFGKCSQIACFVRNDVLDKDASIISTDDEMPVGNFEYKQLFEYVYPVDVDKRSRSEIIMDDAKYFINRHSDEDGRYFIYAQNAFEFPVRDIFEFVAESYDENELRTILRKEFVINENDCVIVDAQHESDYSDVEDYNEIVQQPQDLIDYAEESWD